MFHVHAVTVFVVKLSFSSVLNYFVGQIQKCRASDSFDCCGSQRNKRACVQASVKGLYKLTCNAHDYSTQITCIFTKWSMQFLGILQAVLKNFEQSKYCSYQMKICGQMQTFSPMYLPCCSCKILLVKINKDTAWWHF